MRIAIMVGSLRKESYALKTALALRTLAPPALEMEFTEIGDLPFYNEDLETALPPEGWARFRERISAVEGVLLVTPEYNRSVPAVLKNAIDVGSRPFIRNVWSEKAGAVVSTSPGAIGGFGANHHLRQSLAAVGVAVLPQPELYVSRVAELFDPSGNLTQPKTRDLFRGFMSAFAKWTARITENKII